MIRNFRSCNLLIDNFLLGVANADGTISYGVAVAKAKRVRGRLNRVEFGKGVSTLLALSLAGAKEGQTYYHSLKSVQSGNEFLQFQFGCRCEADIERFPRISDPIMSQDQLHQHMPRVLNALIAALLLRAISVDRAIPLVLNGPGTPHVPPALPHTLLRGDMLLIIARVVDVTAGLCTLAFAPVAMVLLLRVRMKAFAASVGCQIVVAVCIVVVVLALIGVVLIVVVVVVQILVAVVVIALAGFGVQVGLSEEDTQHAVRKIHIELQVTSKLALGIPQSH